MLKHLEISFTFQLINCLKKNSFQTKKTENLFCKTQHK